MAKEDFHYFWGSVFSQWAPSEFEIDGVIYSHAEQYMMAKKALLFKDFNAHRAIMNTKDPKEQKLIGRTVSNFNPDVWNQHCRKFVYEANYAKFTQNPKMFDELMGTGTKEIVEASPEDKIWGIGLHSTNPLAWDKATWQGTNWLGQAIMQVRERLKKEITL